MGQELGGLVLPFGGRSPRLAMSAFVAPTAVMVGDVTLGEGSSVWFGAVVRGDGHYVRIGEKTNIQDHAVIHVTTAKHPAQVGSFVTVGHSAVVHGCVLEEACLIGIGALVLDGATVGKEALVAAGALVPPSMVVPPGVLVAGVPARVKRELSPEERRGLWDSAHKYAALAQAYREQLGGGFGL